MQAKSQKKPEMNKKPTPPCGRPSSLIGATEADLNKNKPKKAWNWQEILEEFLNSKGLRQSDQRNKVAVIALGQKDHFEIQDLVTQVQGKHPELGPATVYRTMTTLCEAGIMLETLRNDTGVPLYEPANEDHHDHIVCLDCGSIFEFHAESIEKVQNKLLNEHGFREARHRHVVYAHCDRVRSGK